MYIKVYPTEKMCFFHLKNPSVIPKYVMKRIQLVLRSTLVCLLFSPSKNHTINLFSNSPTKNGHFTRDFPLQPLHQDRQWLPTLYQHMPQSEHRRRPRVGRDFATEGSCLGGRFFVRIGCFLVLTS